MKTIAGEELERLGKASLFGKSIKIEQKLEDLGDQRPQTIRAVIPFQLKSLNEDERTIEFVGSTSTEDRYGDVIEQGGWELGNFIKNPVVPWGHDYYNPPVAKALEVRLSEGDLVFKAQFATKDEYEFADTIYKLYKGGYLRAFSVGFIPLEYDGNWVEGYTFKRCELLEVSCVTVPANPEALTLAFGEGVLSDGERKAMIGKAQGLIKALTQSEESSDNEDMETAKALKEVTDKVEVMQNALIEIKAALVAKTDNGETDVKEEVPADGEPADKPAGGTEDEPETKTLKLTSEAVRAAVKGAVSEELDYQLGKIN